MITTWQLKTDQNLLYEYNFVSHLEDRSRSIHHSITTNQTNMNCVYETSSSEQEMRAEPQYHHHTNDYTTLTSPYAAAPPQPASMIKMESSQIVANNSSDSSIKQQSNELHTVSITSSSHSYSLIFSFFFFLYLYFIYWVFACVFVVNSQLWLVVVQQWSIRVSGSWELSAVALGEWHIYIHLMIMTPWWELDWSRKLFSWAASRQVILAAL